MEMEERERESGEFLLYRINRLRQVGILAETWVGDDQQSIKLPPFDMRFCILTVLIWIFLVTWNKERVYHNTACFQRTQKRRLSLSLSLGHLQSVEGDVDGKVYSRSGYAM